MSVITANLRRIIIALTCGLSVMPAPAVDDEAVLTLYFRDSETGAAVVPQSVTVDDKEMRPAVQYPSGKLEMLTTVGDHQVVVRAHGYREMMTRETAVAEHPPFHLLHLDPLSPPPDLRSSALTDMLTTGVSLITGYVINDKTGLPMPEVEVQIQGGQKVQTNPRGFFVAEIQVPQEKALPDQPGRYMVKKNLTISMPGFDTEERMNIAMITGERKTLKIRLRQGSGVNSEDEDQYRGNLLSGMRHDHQTNPTDHTDQSDRSDPSNPSNQPNPSDAATTVSDSATTPGK